jgi:uncharacterized protein YbjQ (UPF0145 family)
VWECKKCRERVENSFEVCWNCGTSRDGTEDPSFRHADDAAESLELHQAAPPPLPRATPVSPAPIPAATPPARRRRTARPLIVTTGNEVSGRPIAVYLGVVRGVVVRAPGIMQGFLGSLKQMVGGNIEAYAEVCEEARRDAYERMTEHAAELGADAVIGMRYDATEFAEGVTEVLAYGTAVKLGGEPFVRS